VHFVSSISSDLFFKNISGREGVVFVCCANCNVLGVECFVNLFAGFGVV
jgi:hypothetical protein